VTAERQRSYRFATEAQWSQCISARTDGEALRATGVMRPLAPYSREGALFAARGAHAPAVTPAGEILWADGQGAFHRMLAGDDEPTTASAPTPVARAARIVATSSGLWVIGAAPDTLECYDEETLTRRLVVHVSAGRLVDIAGDGRDALFVLVDDDGTWKILRIDRSGRAAESTVLTGFSHATAFVFVRRLRRFVVLVGDHHQRLVWFAAGSERSLFGVTVAALRPCFAASTLGSDARERILLAGSDAACGGSAEVLALDADGQVVGEVPLDSRDAPASGVVATRDALLVTGPRGLTQFGVTAVVPQGAEHVRCTVITPMLFSPDREDGHRWLRVDATATLPEGSSIELTFAATDDAETRDRLNAIATDIRIPASERVGRFLSDGALWRGRTAFGGTEATSSEAGGVFSAKLFDVREPYVWVCVTLSASAGARLPEFRELRVLYPGLTLMEKLPAIYQREEAQPDSFLRDLVGLLETTTQELDARIASMGSRIHPSTAPGPWLDFVARWLGVPWDDGLTLAQKRAIVLRAAELARGRGTRAGLEALLECLLPGSPSRFRVTDATADVGYAIVGGASCTGSTLPTMLAGRTRWSAELDARAVLGHMRLPCPAQRDDGAWQLAGTVRLEVAATATERAAWAPWFRALVAEMIPVTARLELRWVGPDALRSDRLDGTYVITSAPVPHLGVDAVTDLARLPERGIRLSASGSNISTRLR
jgi:phage tail-like protein